MAWLFERTIELAAWVAFILGIVFLCEAVYLLVQWALALRTNDPAPGMLLQSGQAAASFVLCGLAIGILTCIDRYVFDQPEPAKSK